MNRFDLAVRIRHEMNHLTIVLDGHNLAGASIGNDERKQSQIISAARKCVNLHGRLTGWDRLRLHGRNLLTVYGSSAEILSDDERLEVEFWSHGKRMRQGFRQKLNP